MEPRNGRQAVARARQEIEVNGAEEIEANRPEEKGLGEETMRCADDCYGRAQGGTCRALLRMKVRLKADATYGEGPPEGGHYARRGGNA